MADTLNGKDLKEVFGVTIIKIRDPLLRYPKRKASLTFNWAEENGTQVDLSAPRLEDRTVNIDLLIQGAGYNDFYSKYNAFGAELILPGLQELFVDSFQRSFQIYYQDCTAFEVKTQLNADMVGALFSIIVILPASTIITETIINGNG